MKVNELLNEGELPQEAVGKSAKVIAQMLKPDLEKVGIKLKDPAPIKDEKAAIWSVESSKYPDHIVVLYFSSRPRGGRGRDKPRILSMSFGLFNKDGTPFEPEKMNKLTSIAAVSFDGIGNIYKERVK